LASIMFLSIRRIYSIIQRLFPQLILSNGYDEILFILTISSLLLLILGILFEVIKKIIKSNILEDELTVFYNLMEFNYHSSIVLFDKNKKLIYANERLRQRYSSGKSLNMGEQYKELQSFIERTIKDEITLSIENIIEEIEKRGAWKTTLKVKGRFIRVECQKLYVKTGKYYYAASISDVTDDYELHEKLNKSRSIVENITENIQDLIVVIDNDSNITYTNGAVKKSLEYTEEDLIGQSIKNLLLEEIADKVLNSDGSRIECALIKKEKNEFLPVEAINSDVVGKDGAILGRILVFRDLSISNEINILTKQFNEVKVYEKARSEFFANLSHEFRTPLNIFSSTIQLLDLKCDKDECNFHEEYKIYREGLKHNCNRMIRLISNIIDITKIDSGMLQGEFTNYNIVELVENVTMSIIPYSKSKNLKVVFDTLIEELNIKCDLHKIERAILNILSNAIKFTKQDGNILVEVSNDEQWVYINIKDDGRGISEEMQQLIFERFVQADKSLNRNTEGSGMGLCIAKAMINIHGGEITLQSDGVKGSEFIIKLPNVVIEEVDIMDDSHIIDIQRVELELSDIYELY
ncbi:MAG: ATP-binding protein, partial [Sarcina sp.]